jgi:Na+-transporting methylmalonyl-CoA/oxaloacetate decarboxylase gamma subunit
MYFNGMAFLENLKYMGLGMLGIFAVMGLIILAVYGLGALNANRQKKKNKQQNEE